MKTRRESVDAYTKAGREDLAAKEQAEIAILDEYLPGRVERGGDRSRSSTRPWPRPARRTPRDMGKVMGWLSPRIRGRADGKIVSGLVASRLARADLAAHDRSPH